MLWAHCLHTGAQDYYFFFFKQNKFGQIVVCKSQQAIYFFF